MPEQSRKTRRLGQLAYTVAIISYILTVALISLQGSMPCSGQQWKALGILTLNYWLLLSILGNIRSWGSVQSLVCPLRIRGAVITVRISIVGVAVLVWNDGKALNLPRLLILLNTRSSIADIIILSLYPAHKSC